MDFQRDTMEVEGRRLQGRVIWTFFLSLRLNGIKGWTLRLGGTFGRSKVDCSLGFLTVGVGTREDDVSAWIGQTRLWTLCIQVKSVTLIEGVVYGFPGSESTSEKTKSIFNPFIKKILLLTILCTRGDSVTLSDRSKTECHLRFPRSRIESGEGVVNHLIGQIRPWTTIYVYGDSVLLFEKTQVGCRLRLPGPKSRSEKVT